MAEPIIRVENLGKKYQLRHQEGGPRYRALRDVIAGAGKSALNLFRGRSRTTSVEEFWALKDVSFDINEGEVVGIIGRNGAGKSTLLKILSRITEPTTGRVTLNGRVASLLEVGTGFHPELTGRENIYLNGAILGMGRAEINRKFDEIVAFAEVEKFLDTPVKRYSSGMYVRLAFAVAAHLEPEILVVDEVLAVGDAAFQKKCLGKMGEVAKGGRTVLFVSHNMQAVEQLTQSVILLAAGKLIFQGATVDGVARYADTVFRESGLGIAYACKGQQSRAHVAFAAVKTSESGGEHVCNRPFAIEFGIRLPPDSGGVQFSVQICDDLGRSHCHFWLLDRGADFDHGPGEYRLQVNIPKLRLYLGRYTLTTWLTDRRGDELLESLKEICPFEVTMRGIERGEYDWKAGAMAYYEEFEWGPVTKSAEWQEGFMSGQKL